MRGNMQPTTVYFDAELIKTIGAVARMKRMTKAETIRKALKEGLRCITHSKSPSTGAFVEMEGLINDKKLPKNLSEKYNELLYG
jgi:hypothetical protein